MGNSSSSSQSPKELSTAAIVTSEKRNILSNETNNNIPSTSCATSTAVSSETIPPPLLVIEKQILSSPGKRLLDLSELIASKEKEMQSLLDQLAEARDREIAATEYSTLQINEFNEEMEMFYETSRNESIAACDNALKEIIQEKDNELTNTISTLQTVIFPERLLFAKEDIMSRCLVNELNNEWNYRYNELKHLQEQDIETVTRIAQQEYDKTRSHLKGIFMKEIEELEEKIRVEKKKRGSGIFSWLSPAKKSKPESDEEEDEENNVEN